MKQTYKGGTYEGEVNAAGLPHGAGTLTRPDGLCYTGAWQNGIYHGHGTMT